MKTVRSLHVAIALLVFALFTTSLAGTPSASAGAEDDPHSEFLVAAYRDLLGRQPDASGFNYWRDQLVAGASPSSIAAAIGDADEQRRLVVTQAYDRVLKRSPDSEGLDFWSHDIIDRSSEADLYSLFFGSEEYFITNGQTNEGYVSALYRDILTRQPEPGGFEFWTTLLNEQGHRRDLIAREFLASAEAILQPNLSIVTALPLQGSMVGNLSRITIDLDREIDAGRSAIIVSAGGQRVLGTTNAGDDASQLVFSPASLPSGLRRGVPVDVIVTIFAYSSGSFGRTDYDYTLNPSITSALNELIVAFYGHAKTGDLGILGEGTPHEALVGLQTQMAPYSSDPRPIVPAFELIATLVTAAPGADDLYRARTDHALIRPFLDEISAANGYLILDLQPGRADLEDEARAYEALLLEPEVGLALDPEWKVSPDETPKGRVGAIDAEEINRVSAYLSDLVVANDLPNKILIVHRFRPDMVTNPDQVLTRPGVTIIFQADGEGSPGAKVGDYDTLLPDRFGRGFKVFYDEDSPTLSPAQVLDILDPAPDYISYQ